MLRRIFAIIEKEFFEVFRQPVTVFIIFSIPLTQLLIFAYAINTNVRHIPTIVADQSLDTASRSYLDALVNSEYFNIVETTQSREEVLLALDSGRVNAGVIIPPNFAEDAARGEAQAMILVDGSDQFTSSSAYNAATILGRAHAAEVSIQQITNRQKTGQNSSTLEAHLRVLYNPDMLDLWFLIPGMIAMVIQAQTISFTASAVVRERETGTIEQILVTPIRPLELMLGKIAPYFVMSLINGFMVLALGHFWFGVPFQGNFWLFILLYSLFLASSLGLGLLVSAVTENQRQAAELAMLLTQIALLLGGFIFPRYTMPVVIQWIGGLFPMTYFIPIARGIITKGVDTPVLAGEITALLVYSVVVLLLASRAFRDRME